MHPFIASNKPTGTGRKEPGIAYLADPADDSQLGKPGVSGGGVLMELESRHFCHELLPERAKMAFYRKV